MDPHWFSSLNPDPPRDKKLDSDQCGSTTLLSRSIRSLQLFRDDIHGSLKNKKIQIFLFLGGIIWPSWMQDQNPKFGSPPSAFESGSAAGEKHWPIEEGRAAKSSVNIWLFFLFPSKKFLPNHSKFSCWKLLPQKREGTKIKAARYLFFLMSFLFLYIWYSLQSSLTVYTLPILSAAEIEPGKHMAKTRFGLEK